MKQWFGYMLRMNAARDILRIPFTGTLQNQWTEQVDRKMLNQDKGISKYEV